MNKILIALVFLAVITNLKVRASEKHPNQPHFEAVSSDDIINMHGNIGKD